MTVAGAETLTLWPCDPKSQLVGKDLDVLRNTEGKRKRGWQRMRWLDSITDSREMNLSPGDSGGQRSLMGCSPWGCQDSDVTYGLNNHKIFRSGASLVAQW